MTRDTEPSEKSGRRGRPTAIIATAGALVGLATGIFTLRDQLFPKKEQASPAVVVNTGGRELPRFKGIASHFEESEALLEFLVRHDREAVLLDVRFRVPDQFDPQGDLSGFPPTTLYTDCDPLAAGEEPSSTKCTGTEIVVLGEPTEDSLFGVAHGSPVLEGYFRVRASGGETMGIRPIALSPETRQQAQSG